MGAAVFAISLPTATLAAPASAKSDSVVDLVRVEGDLPEGVRASLRQRLHVGLSAAKVPVITVEEAAMPDAKACDTADCYRQKRNEFGGRFLILGKLQRHERNFAFDARLVDAQSGETLGDVTARCRLCGLAEVSEKVNLAASALASKLIEAQKRQATLTVRAVRNGADAPGAEVTLNGRTIGRAPLTVPVAPGEHQLVVTVDGCLPVQRAVTLVSGVSDTQTVTLIEKPSTESGSSVRPIVGWTAVGTGLAAVGAGAVLLALGSQNASCNPADVGAVNTQCRELQNMKPVAIGLLAGGAAAAVFGGLTLTHWIW